MRNKDIAKEKLIIQSALSMIAEIGLAGLKMNDLAQNARLATGTVYIYFSSKEVLIQKIYAYIFEQVTMDLQANIEPEMDIRARIRQSCFNYVVEIIRHPEYKIFLEQFLVSPYFDPDDAHLEHIAIYRQPIVQLVHEGQETGVLKNTPAELLIQVTRGALEKYAFHIARFRKEIDENEFDLVFDFIWSGGAVKS